MIVIAGICVGAAVVIRLVVSDQHATAPRLAPRVPARGCARPVAEATP
jgi:hypothetical protein